jgi:thiol-disulfide isomerase/thioredoxin
MKYFPVLCLALLVIMSPAPVDAGAEIPVGGTLQNLPMQGLTGTSRFISEYRGKPLIINVWASYCTPCLAEMGSLERLWQQYGDEFNVIGISIDDFRQRADEFLSRAETTFPHFIDRNLQLETMLGANTIPLTLLIDSDSRVLKKVHGAQEWDSAEIVDEIGQIYGIDL